MVLIPSEINLLHTPEVYIFKIHTLSLEMQFNFVRIQVLTVSSMKTTAFSAVAHSWK
jgi:hypothetical protein